MSHLNKVEKLQAQLRRENSPLSFSYKRGFSNTTRSKSYNNGHGTIDCSSLNEIVKIHPEKRRIFVEPRVTMEELVKATLPFGLCPPVVPEFKGITVGGALMGGAGESSSHKFGLFHDPCLSLKILSGNGEVVYASPTHNADLFYGMFGSYGSLGLLLMAELPLIPVKQSVKLTYHAYDNLQAALQKIEELFGKVDFVDGLLFSKNEALIIEGNFSDEASPPFNSWYIEKLPTHLPLFDYLFRYDFGAFWMGSYLFRPSFLSRYILEGLCGKKNVGHFTPQEIDLFKTISYPPNALSTLFSPWMNSQALWKLLHKAPKWVQDRLIIQDCSIPLDSVAHFLEEVLDDPATFPIWLCPILGTDKPQLFSPHVGHEKLINVGIYGTPSYSAPMQKIIRNLENQVQACSGRKVLYSRSYYSEEEFWKIYPRKEYEALRQKTASENRFHTITKKVLSE